MPKLINQSGRTFNGVKHGSSRDVPENNASRYLRAGFIVFGEDQNDDSDHKFTKKQAIEFLEENNIEYNKRGLAAELVELAIANGLTQEEDEEDDALTNGVDTSDLGLLDDNDDDGNGDEDIDDLLGDDDSE